MVSMETIYFPDTASARRDVVLIMTHDPCPVTRCRAVFLRLCRVSHHQVLLRHRKPGFAERLANDAIRIEVHLPVVVGVTVRSDREYGPGQINVKSQRQEQGLP